MDLAIIPTFIHGFVSEWSGIHAPAGFKFPSKTGLQPNVQLPQVNAELSSQDAPTAFEATLIQLATTEPITTQAIFIFKPLPKFAKIYKSKHPNTRIWFQDFYGNLDDS